MGSYIPLGRVFSPIPKHQQDAERDEILSAWGHIKPQDWDAMDREFRCVILAEAGAGKTEELREHSRGLKNQGKPSFFIRIEDIEADFRKAFEVGDEAQFLTWLRSTDEAWFFLDSVDEARLESPRAFEKALRCFANGIKEGAHRAHVYISSRPYAWRTIDDRRLLDDLLYLAAPLDSGVGEEGQRTEPQSALTIYTMRPLDKERIRRFCVARAAKNVDHLLQDIERANLWSLAERPFDLEGILAKWEEDNALGGRLSLLQHNVNIRLRDDHNTDRAQRQPLNLEVARKGVRRLAAAVVLTAKAGISVPDGTPLKPGIDAESILGDWDPRDVHTVLERAIFNDITYGAVRFRHRDVCDLLAAEWFDELLRSGSIRHRIENLFFPEQYGQKIVTPRLRPILPWLILLDDEIRRRALEIHPEIAIEGGDPSRLPLLERRRILADIVRRIASDEDDRSVRDNSAIARIASPDLADDTLHLISEYGDNDDAIFFLGRLVWQGEMSRCAAPFVAIAIDDSRGIYARRAAARAVVSCGSAAQRYDLWQGINESNARIPRELLAELVDAAGPDSSSIMQLVISLGKLQPYERFKSTGLGQSLHEYSERLRLAEDPQVITNFLDELLRYLQRPPHVKQGECGVSDEYAWMLSPTLHVVERLVKARNAVSLGTAALSIMLMAPAQRYLRDDYYFTEYKSELATLVPRWPELNDALYWASIEKARAAKSTQSSEQVTDDWSISWLGHFWTFDTGSLPRLLQFIQSRDSQNDRLVALSTAFRVFIQSNRETDILTSIQRAVSGDRVLRDQLEVFLHPPESEMMRRYEDELEQVRRQRDDEKERRKQARETWIAELRAAPDRVRNPPNLAPGEFTGDHYWLMSELRDRVSMTDRIEYSNWQALVPDFGEDVSKAYRDAAINHWRHYVPLLRSEGAQANSIPYSLIFGMAGLQIEATEHPEFPVYLHDNQVRHALRYITWELNGFPSWLERMYRAFPDLVQEAVLKELHWELENAEPDKPMHYILSDVVYHAPWLHPAIAPSIFEWVECSPARMSVNFDDCLYILVNGGTDPASLSSLARRHLDALDDPDSMSVLYALRVDCEPEKGILELKQWLVGLDKETSTRAAQIFVTSLVGGRRRGGRPQFGRYQTAEHLKALYVLMHIYIPAHEDIDRLGGGAYSPALRDDAQDARNQLFVLLSKIPGKASYSVIRQLILEHPDPGYRPWMAKQAYKRAEEDGDLEPWTAEQVNDFYMTHTLKPETHRQLYELAVGRLNDLKNWLERGNDSPYETWQLVKDEIGMRKLIAGWLNQQRHDRYITAQEPELANSQRMDIWLQNADVMSPVPIELKLLDKGWTGPKLCERLRNQLAGDYLREETAGCGVMLLMSQKAKLGKTWRINGRRVKLSELADALRSYWDGISDKFPGVDAIEVIVIDLDLRAHISDS